MAARKTALVISAHAADFVWRAGGAIALHQKKGYEVTIVCLSYGERGESAELWRKGCSSLEAVKATRRNEAESAAHALNAHDIQFFDLGDYPLEFDREAKFELAALIRKVQPHFMMSHPLHDFCNVDHALATKVAIECRMIAQAWGHNPGETVWAAPQLYLFEPHQTEQTGWRPDVLLNISDVWDNKLSAIRCIRVQKHLWGYYTNLAENRASHFRSNQGGQTAIYDNAKPVTYAEAFQSVYPRTVDEL